MKLIDPQQMARKRRRRGFTQANLAALASCTQQYISAMETGADTDCSERIARLICKHLDVDLEDLFRDIDPVPMPTDASSPYASKREVAA